MSLKKYAHIWTYAFAQIRFCPNSIKFQYFLMRLTLCERYNSVFGEYSGYYVKRPP